MIYDTTIFNGEYDILEIRLNILAPFVDKFIIVEGAETFSGNVKPLYWIERDKDRFAEWEDKIVYKVITDYDDEDINNQILERADYVDQSAFKKAFYQKESIRKVLEGLSLNDEDIVYFGDVDEIWKPQEVDGEVYKLRQLAYSYYLNNRSPEDWRGTIVTKWKNLRNGCLNDMRAKPKNILEDGGWHFTNLGGLQAIKLKLESYDHQEINIPWVKDGLATRLADNVDFLGRNFSFWVEENDLPPYILENKERWIRQDLWKI